MGEGEPKPWEGIESERGREKERQRSGAMVVMDHEQRRDAAYATVDVDDRERQGGTSEHENEVGLEKLGRRTMNDEAGRSVTRSAASCARTSP